MDRIQLRRDTSARWAEINPILLEGEVGYEIDTKLRKIGDGVNRWNDLEYLKAEGISQETGNSQNITMSQDAITRELAELGSKVNNVESGENVNENSIVIEDNDGNVIAEINSKHSSFKNLRNNGKDVLTEHQDLSWVATKEESYSDNESVIFSSDDFDFNGNGEEYVLIGRDGLRAKQFRLLDGSVMIGSQPKKVDCYGASHVDDGTWIDSLQNLLGDMYIVRNYGVGGQSAARITYRQGAVPFYTKEPLIVPSAKDEKVQIKLNRWPGDSSELTNINVDNKHSNVNPVSICRIEGNLTYENDSYYFARLNDGVEMKIPAFSEVRTHGYKDKGDITILWLGSNIDLESETNYNYTLSLIKKSTEAVVNGKYLVIGNHAARQDSGYNMSIETIKRFNSDLKSEYGYKFVDQLEYMREYGLELLGLEPTSEDLLDKEEGKVPRQLLDSIQLHYTNNASRLLGELFYSTIVENGYLGNNW